MPVFEVADLKKSYGDVQAIRGISFAVEQGECLAVLGPNGAGKTTTVEILEGYRTRDSGTVNVLGVDPALILTALIIALGLIAYGVTFPGRYPALLLAIVIGAFCFSALGIPLGRVGGRRPCRVVASLPLGTRHQALTVETMHD